ncbi:hypothetical protein ACXYMX_16790 [Sporosarcina sp. CAU 1771]
MRIQIKVYFSRGVERKYLLKEVSEIEFEELKEKIRNRFDGILICNHLELSEENGVVSFVNLSDVDEIVASVL